MKVYHENLPSDSFGKWPHIYNRIKMTFLQQIQIIVQYAYVVAEIVAASC